MRLSRPSTDQRRAPQRPDRRGALGDAGSAALEFIVAGLVLLVPTVYLVVTLGLIQEQSLGAEAAARHIARAIATSTGQADAETRATEILASIATEYGMDVSAVGMSTSCLPAGSDCPEAGAVLVVTVTTRVTLPLVPPVLGLDRIAVVPVEATSAQQVSRFWESE